MKYPVIISKICLPFVAAYFMIIITNTIEAKSEELASNVSKINDDNTTQVENVTATISNSSMKNENESANTTETQLPDVTSVESNNTWRENDTITNSIPEDENSTLENKNSTLENENSTLENKNSTLENKNSTLENKNSTLENKNSTLENENSTLENENSTLENKNSTLENENSTLENKNSTLENKNFTLENKNSTLENENSTLENKNSILENKNSILENKNSILENENSILENKNSKDLLETTTESIDNEREEGANSIKYSSSDALNDIKCLDLNHSNHYIDKMAEEISKYSSGNAKLHSKFGYFILTDGKIWGLSNMQRVGDVEISCTRFYRTLRGLLRFKDLTAKYKWSKNNLFSLWKGHVLLLVDKIDVKFEIKQNDSGAHLDYFKVKDVGGIITKVTGMTYSTWIHQKFINFVKNNFLRTVSIIIEGPLKEAFSVEIRRYNFPQD